MSVDRILEKSDNISKAMVYENISTVTEQEASTNHSKITNELRHESNKKSPAGYKRSISLQVSRKKDNTKGSAMYIYIFIMIFANFMLHNTLCL